jgi:hypothetical protein
VAKKRCMRKNWRKRALVKTEKRAPDRSRAETHANLLVFEWHCIYEHVFLLQWRKDVKAQQNVCGKSEYQYLYDLFWTKYAQENMIISSCADSSGAWKDAKGSRKRRVKAVLGNQNFELPPNNILNCQPTDNSQWKVYFSLSPTLFKHHPDKHLLNFSCTCCCWGYSLGLYFFF